MLDFVSADEEDARTIHWVYSIEGDVGKSWLKDYMVKTYEALVVAVDEPTDVKHLILTAMKGKNNDKFKKNPIVIADLSLPHRVALPGPPRALHYPRDDLRQLPQHQVRGRHRPVGAPPARDRFRQPGAGGGDAIS